MRYSTPTASLTVRDADRGDVSLQKASGLFDGILPTTDYFSSFLWVHLMLPHIFDMEKSNAKVTPSIR